MYYNPDGIKIPCFPCVPQETVIKDVQLAASYVPFQRYCGVMSPIESLVKGTAFCELFSPYKKREFSNIEPEVCKVCAEGGKCHDE